MCPNQHIDLLRFLFAEDSLNQKGPGISFQAIFFIEFFEKKFSFVMFHQQTSDTRLMTFEYLES